MIPDDYLLPIWRARPAAQGTGVFTVGLDPREAAYVLERGWATIDGARYRITLEGCDGQLQRDGRIQVRGIPLEESLTLPLPDNWPTQVEA